MYLLYLQSQQEINGLHATVQVCPKWIPESTEGLKGIMCLVSGIMRKDRSVTLLVSVGGLIADCMAQKKKKIHTNCFFIQAR